MNGTAYLLAGPSDATTADRLEKILAVFGIPAVRVTAADILTSGGVGLRLLGTAAAFSELLAALERSPDAAAKIHSAFVVAAGDTRAWGEIARLAGVATRPAGELPAVLRVSDELPEFCSSMSGVRVDAAGNEVAGGLVLDGKIPHATEIIAGGSGALFARLAFHSIPLFLSAADVIDVSAPLPGRGFDLRANFMNAVPAVMYTRWAFAESCWRPPETCACLVIDDPLLRPRYGFLNFQRLLELMERVDFSTSIAFIPWNWKRSARRTVRLFKDNPRRFSLSIHGCDHTGGEYGSHDRDRLVWKSRQALERMLGHQSHTGLTHDRVMVFPQGVFSAAAMDALKHAGFIGVVNSEVVSAEPSPHALTIADYWDLAVMNYSEFPIFTRRYPAAGVENFAFDILLGKPCIIVVHHNDCHDECRHLVQFIERLNRLNVRLRWTSLAEVVRRGFRQREVAPGVNEIEIYGSEVRVENPSSRRQLFRFHKRESNPESIAEIRAGMRTIDWKAGEGRLEFEIELAPGEDSTVVIAYSPLAAAFPGESLRYGIKAMVRRHLCEFRDNYLMRKSFSS